MGSDATSIWTPTSVPSGTATFAGAQPATVTFSALQTSIGAIQFNAGAGAYMFQLGNNELDINGAGIVNNSGSAPSFTSSSHGLLQFNNSSTAGTATITNSDNLDFQDTSTAGNATITNTSSGVTLFDFNGTAANARLINNSGGIFDFSGSAGPKSDHALSAGSIEGDGFFYLGANQLTVGGNNLSTTVSGGISDCGSGSLVCFAAQFQASVQGGSLVKTGTTPTPAPRS